MIQLEYVDGMMISKRKKFSKKERAHILSIKGGKCRWCTSNKDLEIHHIDGNSKNNDYNNLALLCKGDHSMIERYIAFIARKKKDLNKEEAKMIEIENTYYEHYDSLDKHEDNIRYLNDCIRQLNVRIMGQRGFKDDVKTWLLAEKYNLPHKDPTYREFAVSKTYSLINRLYFAHNHSIFAAVPF